MQSRYRFLILVGTILGFLLPPCLVLAQDEVSSTRLFGYREEKKEGFGIFPQWVSVMKRHEADQGNCPINLCRVPEWQSHVASLRGRPPREQLAGVNEFANRFRYVLDQDNYGKSDYWAIPREFLQLGGDCEDFAIIKYFSLRQLGFPIEALRITIVQDTNLRIPHAILAVHLRDDIVILDNQIPEVISHRSIAHYAPVYSLNERNWWMHLP